MKLSHFFITLLYLLPSAMCAQNLVSSQSWTPGTGSVGIFDTNGTAAENIREMGVGPHGDQVLLWKAAPDGNAQADGGWDTGWFPIDHTKMYRFSVWIKKTNSTDGTTYFGCRASDILSLSGTVNSNPYFWAGDLPALDKWYLLVGYVHASTDASTTNYGGIYDGETGSKIDAITDYKFSSTATSAVHRTYLYYDPNTSDRQYFYGPEVYQVESTQPVSEFNSSTMFNGNAFFGAKVGIGTTNPQGNLHLDAPTAEIVITAQDEGVIRGNGLTWLFGYNGTTGSEDISIGTQDGTGSRTVTLAAGGGARMKILSNGNVGIGTSNPNEKLTVNGAVYAKEVKVDLSVPGPDYVFFPNYNLRPVEELKDFIDRHGHLPEIPDAKQMEKNGINTGEMNMLLLKKIEELTLYVIELKKENAELRDSLTTRINAIEERIK